MEHMRETIVPVPVGMTAPRENPGSRDPRRAEFEVNKLKRRLRRQVGQAIADYGMIEEGDRVMVCLSGGKDSYGLLEILCALKDKAPVRFRDHRRQPGPEAARISGGRSAPIPDGARDCRSASPNRTPTASSSA